MTGVRLFSLLAAIIGSHLVVGGQTVKETPLGHPKDYDQIKAITFSDDSRHLAFLGTKGDKQYFVVDGVEGAAYDWIIPDSIPLPLKLSRLGIVIQNGNEMFAVIDGKISAKGYFFIGNDRINFAADGKHYAYTAREGNSTTGTAVVSVRATSLFQQKKGRRKRAYSTASAVPIFSPDGNHLAYVAAPSNDKMCVVIDGKEDPVYDSIVPGTFTFSPDSKHFAYTAFAGKKYLAVIDGKPSKPYELMRLTPIFSPDSSRVRLISSGHRASFASWTLAWRVPSSTPLPMAQ